MDELIQKYLDGDLSDEDAAVLTRALADDPALEAELRALEQALALTAANVAREPSPAFTDLVMERVEAGSAAARKTHRTRRRRTAGESRVWWPRLAWAAGFAFVFAMGFVAARQLAPVPDGVQPQQSITSTTRENGSAQVAAAQTNGPVPLRLVRLVYVPSDEDVERVTVAGTFNGWDAQSTEMHKEAGAWIVQLVLPPETYEYMFVENGEQWVTDPLAMQTRDDGFGRENAVLDLTM